MEDYFATGLTLRTHPMAILRQEPPFKNATRYVDLINVVIWSSTQQHFRSQILTGKLLVINGTVEILTEGVATPVIHVIAGKIEDITPRLQTLSVKSRDFH